MPDDATADLTVGTGIDTSVPHSARIWNYWMGGKDNYPVDREAGDAYREQAPSIVPMALASRAYLIRAVSYLAGTGVRQFLDIGTGLPTNDNTHQVAQRINPRARIVYVDNDPLVLTHAEALLTSTPQGLTEYIDADLHHPEAILAQARDILDFDEPIALMLMGILGHIANYEQAQQIVRTLLAPLPSGSYLVHYDSTSTDPQLVAAQQGYDDTGAIPYVLRAPVELAVFYEGLELVEPGLVSCPLWRPDVPNPKSTHVHGAVARKA
jgi:hypothetical protein